MTYEILPPIKETPEDYEALEEYLFEFFREHIYRPLLLLLKASESELLTNATSMSDEELLVRAIQSGQIHFYRGKFSGRFNSKLSRALKSIGAEWDRREQAFSVPVYKLPANLKHAVNMSEAHFDRVAGQMLSTLEKIQIEKIPETLNLAARFDKSISKVEKEIKKTLRGITVEAQLSDAARERIAKEYAQSLELPIQAFVVKETEELRKKIMERSYAGFRYEVLAKDIQASYGVSQRKAKFLARQETALLMAKFKQVRYQEAGSDEYIWGCVTGTPAHPVRHYHRLNEGKKFRWDTGAPINAAGTRKNPGQDYNCRCFPKPIVKF